MNRKKKSNSRGHAQRQQLWVLIGGKFTLIWAELIRPNIPFHSPTDAKAQSSLESTLHPCVTVSWSRTGCLCPYAAVLSVVTQRSYPQGGGALRGDTKNGFVGEESKVVPASDGIGVHHERIKGYSLIVPCVHRIHAEFNQDKTRENSHLPDRNSWNKQIKIET